MFPEKLGFRQGRADASGEGVADVGRGDASGGEELLFEREDAEQAVDDAAHDLGSSLTPGPDLGRYEVDDWDTEGLEFGGDAEMEVGGVGEDGELWSPPLGGFDKAAELLIDSWDMVNYFN